MTQTSTAPVLPVPDATATGRNSIPGRWLVLPIIALTLLAIAAFIGSRFVAGSPLVDQVDVRVTNSECSGDGTSVRSGSRITTVETAEDMRCTFTVQIENQSERDVTLGDVRAVVMGPDTGPAIRAETIDGVTPRGDGFGIDAIYDLDRSLPAGTSATLAIVAAFNPQGRNDGGTLKPYHFPQVHVSALGVDRVIGGPKTLAFDNPIHTPCCDAL